MFKLRYLFDIPKTIYFNFRVLPVKQAVKLPFYVSRKYRMFLPRNAKSIFLLSQNCSTFSIRFGNGGSEDIIPNAYGIIQASEGSNIIFNGSAKFAAGCSIKTFGGDIQFGENFSANRNCSISSVNRITFGDDCLLAYNIIIRDGDGHFILEDGIEKNINSTLDIGNHVWICAHVTLLKGSSVANNVVIGYGSILTKSFNEENVIIAGIPGKIVKQNVNWKF